MFLISIFSPFSLHPTPKIEMVVLRLIEPATRCSHCSEAQQLFILEKIMKKRIIAMAVATIMAAGSTQALAEQNDSEALFNQQDYQAMGIGAVTGAIIAGPVGLIVGGAVGKIYADQNFSTENVENEIEMVAITEQVTDSSNGEVDVVVNTAPSPTTKESTESDDAAMMVASASNAIPMASLQQLQKSKRVKEIIAYDLSMDIYFKPGSVNFESFYSRQLASILNLMEAMPELQLNLDGYSDRQGSKDDNLQLSVERLDSVKDYFISKGVDVNRINLNAHGEKNFLSMPGELDTYIFDRRVVVSFDLSQQSSANSIALLGDISFL